MNLSTNNNYNDYFGAELDDLIGNLEDDNERLLFADFDDGGDLLTTPTGSGSSGMDFQFETSDDFAPISAPISDQTSSIVTPMKIEEDRSPTPCLSRPHQERQQSFQMGANAVNNFNPPSPVVNTINQDVNVNQHQGSESKSSSLQQQGEHPYTKVQYDRALHNLAESMKRTEVSRRQIMMHKRTEMTRRHVTMTRGMLSHEQQRVLHLAKMQLNQQQQQVQQAQQRKLQLQQQNQLQQQILSSPPTVTSFFKSSSATRGSRSSFVNTMDQGRKRFSTYIGQVNHRTL